VCLCTLLATLMPGWREDQKLLAHLWLHPFPSRVANPPCPCFRPGSPQSAPEQNGTELRHVVELMAAFAGVDPASAGQNTLHTGSGHHWTLVASVELS